MMFRMEWRVARRLWVAAALSVSGWSTPSYAPAQVVVAAQPASAALRARPELRPNPTWSVLGRSLEDRVIEYRQFGEGAREVLIVGPLEGDESAALDLLEALAEHLERFPRRTSGVRVTLVRDPNPDGRLRRTAANARGVRLNRNFPTRGWRKIPAGALWQSGREPESEPESRVLVDLFDDLRPDRVIVLAAGRRWPGLSWFGPAEDLAREFAIHSDMRASRADASTEQGSFAVYTGIDHDKPTLVVRVPSDTRRDALWTSYKRSLMAVIGGDEPDETPPAPAGAPSRTMPDLAVVRRAASPISLTFTKGPAARGGAVAPPAKQAAASVRILSADELQFGGELAPVPPVEREFGPATAIVKPLGQAPAARAIAVPRGAPRIVPGGRFPPVNLFQPSPAASLPAANSSRATALPPKSPLSPPRQVERLPRVDQTPPPPPRSSPQPIPLYPATGF